MKKNIDYDEKIKFEMLFNQWWEKYGTLKTLHQINPIRLKYIINCSHGISKKKILDIGCGGGILSESMAKTGADVTGLEIGENLIKIAKQHAKKHGLKIHYINETIEEHAYNNNDKYKNKYDIITCMELLEHVPNPLSIVKACTHVLKKNGNIFFSTINRTFKSWLLIILGAEYILNILPHNTHTFKKFIKPSELIEWIHISYLEEQKIIGISYDIIQKKFIASNNTDINYILYAKRV